MKKLFDTTIHASAVHICLLLLRVGSAALMLTHGLPKLSKVMDGDFQFGDPLGIGSTPSLFMAVFAEVGCSILLILGLATRLATIPLIITMSVATFIVHTKDPFARQELPLLYLMIFIVLLVLGSGKYSIDSRIKR
ncbi:DoxX family protein [Rhodocytophaga rosea]|uniref:DoxX family protein n=1 Tax=Rhodocytophaga rosea TaxID=2704465 RepID=A0A6C0GJ50_9BACT|nr:DoxX family protein [Rhodocytophaga rosea]QHT67824.1 DoxX family protein [Rhodocytophaga rosea]